MSKDDEVVLCVTADRYETFLRKHKLEVPLSGFFDPYSDAAGKLLRMLNSTKNVTWRRRGDVEDNPAFRQIIPYVRLIHDGWTWSYARKGGDPRLDKMRSIGVGGHVSIDDWRRDNGNGTPRAAVYRAAIREITEEMDIPESALLPGRWDFQYHGLIDDRSDRVGQMHLGIVMSLELDTAGVGPSSEGGMTEALFTSPTTLFRTIDAYEGWSRIAIRHDLSKAYAES